MAIARSALGAMDPTAKPKLEEATLVSTKDYTLEN